MDIWTFISICSAIYLIWFYRKKRRIKKALKESQRQEQSRLSQTTQSDVEKRKEKGKKKVAFGLAKDAPDDVLIPFDKVCSWEDGENGKKILRYTPAIPVSAYWWRNQNSFGLKINDVGAFHYSFGVGDLNWGSYSHLLMDKDIIAHFEEGLEAYTRKQEEKQAEIERRTKIIIINEKEEIAKKLKEKQRRRELEKIVRQELIDSGELFGDEPKRPPIPREVVDAVYKRDGGRCVYCGSVENLQLDHIIPFSKGGATTLENLQLLCQKCNIEKSNKIG